MNDAIKENCFSSIEDNFRGAYLKKDQDLNSGKTDTNNFESKSDLTNGSNANNSQVLTSLEENKRGVFSTTKTGIDIEKATFVNNGMTESTNNLERKFRVLDSSVKKTGACSLINTLTIQWAEEEK